jgi:deferrochelatase/peroxidase EfeB
VTISPSVRRARITFCPVFLAIPNSCAPLDGSAETDTPDYRADLQGLLIPLDAYIRRANPRTAATSAQQIMRRGYKAIRGAQGFSPVMARIRTVPTGRP